MKKNNIKIKIYKAIFYMLVITAVVIMGMIIYKYGSNLKNENDSREVVMAFGNMDLLNEEEKIHIEYKGYKVIGVVKIPKINIEYPILEIKDIDPENAKEPMKLSIIKYWGKNVNDFGNLSIAGHNNKNGTMFGKTKNLELGDVIELTDLTGKTIKYSIYNIFKTNPNDVNILLSKDEDVREVTLITCINGNKERLILKAREI